MVELSSCIHLIFFDLQIGSFAAFLVQYTNTLVDSLICRIKAQIYKTLLEVEVNKIQTGIHWTFLVVNVMLFDQIIIYKLCKMSRMDHAPEKML